MISLIYKKEEKSLKNYRPISLTHTDYKNIAFIFAKRLQNILTKLINEQQTAYIKKRYIGKNARLILDVFNTVKQKILMAYYSSWTLKKHSIPWKGISCLRF